MTDLTPVQFKEKIQPMTQIIGIDYGTKRIGVAVSDLMLMSASALGTVNSFNELDNLISSRRISGFVIGLPKQMDGQEGSQAQLARQWASKLQERYQLPILFWDERLSSCAVSRVFIEQANLSRQKQKKVIDKVSATYILQGALDLLCLI